MNQNLNYYKAFYTVAKYRNISKAADALYISQPAISKSLSRLEENLGCSLFHRTSRGVTLTPEGTILYERVREAFQSLVSVSFESVSALLYANIFCCHIFMLLSIYIHILRLPLIASLPCIPWSCWRPGLSTLV